MNMHFPQPNSVFNMSSSSTVIDRQLAADILRCLKRHNESFDQAAADEANKAVDDEIMESGETEAPKAELMRKHFYRETLLESCERELRSSSEARSIALLLEFSTGTVVEWAERTLGLRPSNASNEL